MPILIKKKHYLTGLQHEFYSRYLSNKPRVIKILNQITLHQEQPINLDGSTNMQYGVDFTINDKLTVKKLICQAYSVDEFEDRDKLIKAYEDFLNSGESIPELVEKFDRIGLKLYDMVAAFEKNESSIKLVVEKMESLRWRGPFFDGNNHDVRVFRAVNLEDGANGKEMMQFRITCKNSFSAFELIYMGEEWNILEIAAERSYKQVEFSIPNLTN